MRARLCVCTVALKESRRLSHSVCPVTSAVLTTAGHPGSVQPAVRWPDIHAYWPCQDSPTFPRRTEACSQHTGPCFFFFFFSFFILKAKYSITMQSHSRAQPWCQRAWSCVVFLCVVRRGRGHWEGAEAL